MFRRFIRKHLSRVSTSGEWLPQLDGLRGAAILLVVLYHAIPAFFPVDRPGETGVWQPSAFLSEHGWIGVQLFFAISGFLVALPFARRHLAQNPPVVWRAFYLRRLTRLGPPYLINLLILFALLAASAPAPWETLRAGVPHLLASATYTHQILYGEWSTLNPVAWSLEIEVQFYLLAPFLCQIFRLRSTVYRRVLLGLLILAGGALRDLDHAVWQAHLPGQLCFFLAGFLLLDIYIVDWREKPQADRGWWDLVGIGAWTAIFTLLGTSRIVTYLLPWLVLLAFAGSLRGRFSRRLAGHPAITTLGVLSYTVYLYHVAILGHTRQFLGTVEPDSPWIPAQFALSLLFVLAISALLFVAFERPFMKLRSSPLADAPKRPGNHLGTSP